MKPGIIGILAIAVSLAAGNAAHAKTVCGELTHEKFGETRIYAKDYIATCRPDGSCAAVTYRRDKSAPLGWSHRLSVLRPQTQSPWQVQLTAVTDFADLGDGISLSVDQNEPMRVPFEFLSQGNAINDYLIDGQLTGVIMEEFKPGNSVEWRYARQTDPEDSIKARFSLRGLTKAMRWITCAQDKSGA